MRPYLVLATLAAALALAGCGKKQDAAPQGGGGDRPIPVTLQAVRPQPFVDTLQALGTVRARESVTVTASVSEKVQAVHFDSGDSVRAGAPLVTLVGDAQQAQLREAQAAAGWAAAALRGGGARPVPPPAGRGGILLVPAAGQCRGGGGGREPGIRWYGHRDSGGTADSIGLVRDGPCHRYRPA